MKFSFVSLYPAPFLVCIGILLYLVLSFLHLSFLSIPLIIVAISIGSFDLFKEAITSLKHKQFVLDYIAILAIIVALLTQSYLVGAIIALMLSSGKALEEYGARQAKASLTSLINRIPHTVTTWVNNDVGETKNIKNVRLNELIFIRKGEVIPLDGILRSPHASIDESSLTGEAYPSEKIQTDTLLSGTVNLSNPILVEVIKEEKNSTYSKIITMVTKAQQEKAPFIRLADRYSTVFTFVTLAISSFAYWYGHGLESALAVLVVATPCPLILAAPIAFVGGMNAAAKKRIIIKKLVSIEKLAKVDTMIFDKTGTLTLGKPTVSNVLILDSSYSLKEVLQIAKALERNSLHPLAKAIVNYASENNVPSLHAEEITEHIGSHIQGVVEGRTYILSKLSHPEHADMAVSLSSKRGAIATFFFSDMLKKDTKKSIETLTRENVSLSIFTGDRKAVADTLTQKLGGNITVVAECTPEQKRDGIEALKKQGKTIGMVGDGINDAPALATADVGMVFSNEEETAATAAADIVFLGGNMTAVIDSITIAKRTLHIALQSIQWGIGLSIVAMGFASIGLIPPLAGAGIQELIDVAVIINALRASR